MPPEFVQSTLYFDPSDLKHPVGFNLLQGVEESQKDAYIDLLISSLFDMLIPGSKDTLARTNAETIFVNCVRVLLDTPDATILSLYRMLKLNFPLCAL